MAESKINHPLTAVQFLDHIRTTLGSSGKTSGEVIATSAQVHATLALVEELRTANLIAWLALGDYEVTNSSDGRVLVEVAGRLGLGDAYPKGGTP